MLEETILILSEKYLITESSPDKDIKLEKAYGYFDDTIKHIVIDDLTLEDSLDNKAKLSVFKNKVLRHEIIHAYLSESGLTCNTENNWTQNEEMVDWFAAQIPKIVKTCKELDIL